MDITAALTEAEIVLCSDAGRACGEVGAEAAGISEESAYDQDGYNSEGFNKEGFDRDGFDKEGFDKEGFNKEGFDREGFNKAGRRRSMLVQMAGSGRRTRASVAGRARSTGPVVLVAIVAIIMAIVVLARQAKLTPGRRLV